MSKKIASSHLVAVIYVYYELHKNINMLIEATTFVYDIVLIGLKPPPMTIVNYSRVHYLCILLTHCVYHVKTS